MQMIRLLLFITLSFLSASLFAIDIIRTGHQQLAKGAPYEYNYMVLKTALDITKPEYGEYEIRVFGDGDIPKQRALEQLEQEFGIFNVVMAVTQPEWEKKAITIRIPIRMGLLNYRLLAVHKDNLDKFQSLNTEDELKKLSVGLRKTWATSVAMKESNYNVVDAYSYDSLFAMLENKRFDYIPRGIYEIFDEIESHNKNYPNIVVDPSLVLLMPAPYYTFVSPYEPRIAQRLTEGLNKMMKQGILKKLIDEYYGESIKKANIKNRKVIHFNNASAQYRHIQQNENGYWLDLLSK